MKANLASPALHFARPAVAVTGIGARLSTRGNKFALFAALLTLFGLSATRALASDPVGIYAIIDKVVFEPSETSPERIQIRGAFAIAEGGGYQYKNAERGYLYYKLNPEKPGACKNEWSDLKSVAGTGKIVSFAGRYGEKGTLRKKDAKPENPDVYPIAFGVTKIRDEKDYEPFKQLAKFRDAKPKNEPKSNN
jgi:hypothetical protein